TRASWSEHFPFDANTLQFHDLESHGLRRNNFGKFRKRCAFKQFEEVARVVCGGEPDEDVISRTKQSETLPDMLGIRILLRLCLELSGNKPA
ncbi:MAG: hypothetical protein ACKOBW_06100, partial [Planctomycetota bacterium]